MASTHLATAISFVQVAAATPQTAQSSVPVMYAAAQLAGDLNVVVVGWNDTSATVTSVVDTSGNVYTRAVGPTTVTGTLSQSIYYAKNIASAAAGANTVTVSFSPAAQFADIRILEYAGLDPTSPLDAAAGASGSGTSSDSGPATTTNANDLIFGASTVTTGATGPGAGFTSRIITSPDTDIAEDEVVTSAGTYHATAPMTNGAWVMQMVAFRAPAAGPPDTQAPTAPTNLVATAASGAQINLTWTASTDNVGVTGYLVERCQGAGCTTFAQVGTSTATSFSDTGLLASTTYGYRVRATDAAGNLGPYSNTATATTLAPPPPASITFVQVAAATPRTAQSSVPVKYAAAQRTGDLNVVVVGWNDTTAVVTSVVDTSGNVYTRAVGPTTVTGTLSQSIYYAKGIAAAAAGANIVTVTFSPAAQLADIRILEYGGLDPTAPLDATAAAAGNGTTSDSGPAATTNANDLIFGANIVTTGTTGPGAGFTSRIITAHDGDIAEDQVVTASGTYRATAPLRNGAWVMQMVAFRAAAAGPPDTQAPTAPTNLVATAASGAQINLTWTASTDNVGVTGYLVERCQGAGCTTFAQVGTSTATSFSDTGLLASTTYGYRVRATDAAGNLGAYSNTATATTLAAPPPATITFVQVAAATPQATLASVPVKYAGAQSAGDLNVVVVGWNDTTAAVTSVVDTSGNVYTRAIGPTTVAGKLSQSIYYAKNVAAAAAGANTVTVSFSPAAQFADIRILEYAGIDPATPVDTTAAAAGTGTLSDSGAASTASANDLIFGASTVTTGVTGPGAGFTSRIITSPDVDIAEDEVVTVTGSYRATAPLSNGSWVMQMVAFRAAPTGPPDTQPPTAPTNLTASAAGGAEIDLAWTAAADNVGVTSYLIERCQGAACTSFAQVATSTVTSYSDTGLLASTSYSYRVRATDAAGNLGPYSGTASATAGFLVSPRVAVITPRQSQQFTANASGVTWSVNGAVGGSASVGTITSGGLYTPPAAIGSFTVQASTAAPVQSASATVFVTDYGGTFTYHNDNLRTGQNLKETVLSASNVKTATFGKLFSYAVDGIPQASPLYVPNVNVPGLGSRNVVYVATEHDSVYAFDADGLSSTALWHVSFINPAAGITTVSPADTGEPLDIAPEIGITGTPVIDPATATLYVVVKTKEVSGATTNFVQRLHALDLGTGAEKLGGPLVIQATVAGTGDGNDGSGHVPFNALRENQREALLLSNGIVYVAFASHGDQPPYHGWVLAYDAATLSQVFAFNNTPNGSEAGIWQSGAGPGADANGYVYFVSGNGTFDASSGGVDYGDSFTKLHPTTGAVVDYFTPHDQSTLDTSNIDLGSAGSLLLPDQPGLHPHLILGAGKNGTIYVVDRDNMGHFRSGNDSQIVQSLVNIFPNGVQEPGNFSAPVYFQAASGTTYVYFGPVQDTVQAFQVSNGLLSTSATLHSATTYDYPGATLAISADGSANPILWALERPGGYTTSLPGVLHAYDATNLSTELFRGDLGDVAVKFTIPTVANGRVYVGAQSQLVVFGLLP